MKRISIIILLLTITFTAWSQRQRQPPPTIEERIEKAKEELTLTDDQVADWKVIFEKYEDQIKEARQNRDREAGASLRTALNEELMATLDQEQKEKFEKIQSNRSGRGRRRG